MKTDHVTVSATDIGRLKNCRFEVVIVYKEKL